MIGQTLSHFEITAKLGEGGMGEVWRADDTDLNRQVAIKVLPAAFTEDSERLARFEREAKLLAQLNHQNIAGIYEVGNAPLSSGARCHYLAMELVEGEDLAERLGRGAMPLDEALDVARQIAEALEVAHEKGIIHRDLKPQNIKIGTDGKVKLLDFGLAKALDPIDPISGGASPQLTHSPTITLGATMEGVVLGTAAYMAPEQAKGQAADKRADIWAFGVVLWEMLSGQRLFGAATASETLAQVLTYEPDLAVLHGVVPPAIRRLLNRCLQRDPKSRLRDIGDASLELRDAVSEPTESTPSQVTSPGLIWLPWAVTAAALVAASLAWMRVGQGGEATPQGDLLKVRFAELGREPGTQSRGFVLSPNGERMVIEEPGRLLMRDRNALKPSVLVDDLVGVEPAPFWSPNGQWVAYDSAGKLWKVPAAGGSPSVICSVPNNYNAGAWGANDRIVFVLTRGDMFSVSARGGNPELLMERVEGKDIDFHQPTFLPDGRSLVYSVHRPSGVDTIEVLTAGERVVVYQLEGEVRLDPQVLNAPIYSATGHLVYRRDAGDEGIWALPFSLEERRTTGDPFLVVGGGEWPSVSADGRRLAYAETSADSLSRLVRVAKDGSSSVPIASGLVGIRQPSISPDGSRIVFSAQVGSGRELFVTDLDGRQARLTNTPESEDSPIWSSDGRMFFYQRGTGEGTAIYRMPVDGSAEPEKILDDASTPNLSSSGRRIVFHTNSRAVLGIGYYDTETDEETILLESASDFGDPKLSPNERVLAYTGWETGQAYLSLRLFPDGTTSQIVPDSLQTYCAWSPDSRTLYYWDNAEPRIMAVSVASEPTLIVGAPEVVLDLDAAGLPPARRNTLSIFPDGESFLMVQSMNAGEGPGDIILVENWLAEFRR